MHPWQQSRAARLAGPLGLSVFTLGGIVALSMVGLGTGMDVKLGPLSALWLILSQGLIAAAYILGAFGLGRPFATMWANESVSRQWIQLALGLALMLSLSHLLGVFGLLSGDGLKARIVGWGVVGIGLAIVADQLIRGGLRPEKWPVFPASSIVWAPALALLLVAAANPPGHLWDSEFGSYDEMSYHLQMPKEWAAGVRLWPTTHNVYSFLPSLVESAFLHMGALQFGPNDALDRMMGGEAGWIIGCHMLHALLAVCAALLTARAAWTLAIQTGAEAKTARLLGVLAGALTLATPWMIVVSSLGYVEAGMMAMGAGGVLVAVDTTLHTRSRGVMCGLLVGVACGCKPTAAFLVAPLVGVLLLGNMPVRAWLGAMIGGSIAGLATLAPWLVRNYLACGNPIFPFGARVFGTAYWTAEQVARYMSHHGAEPGVGLTERVERLFSVEFGLCHELWWMMPWLGASALAVALASSRSRKTGSLLGAGLLAQCLAWIFFTHEQSRFLLPVLTPLTLAIALAGAALIAWVRRSNAGILLRSLSVVVLAMAPLSAGAWSITTFLNQRNATPNALLIGGPGRLTGMVAEEQFQNLTDAERAKFLLEEAGPWTYINLGLHPQDAGGDAGAGVYLLGDGAPLYFVGAVGDAPWPGKSKVLYHTTWDSSPLGQAMLAAPDEPRAWTEKVRQLDCGYVLVNFDELSRLISKDKYYDPAVTVERVDRWLNDPASGLKLVRAWAHPGGAPGTGLALYRIVLKQQK